MNFVESQNLFKISESPTNRYVNKGIKKMLEFVLIIAGVTAGSLVMSPELISSIELAMFSLLNGIGFS